MLYYIFHVGGNFAELRFSAADIAHRKARNEDSIGDDRNRLESANAGIVVVKPLIRYSRVYTPARFHAASDRNCASLG
jgi:hypothetical protein